MQKIRRFIISPRSAPLILLGVAVFAFGLLLPRLGFYWDDWAKILVARLWGLRAYFAYYAEDRPLSSWTHILFTTLLGTAPLGWQVLNLGLRWLSAWGMLWTLNLVWPAARRQNLAAALLFLVYPVFTQQSAAVTFHQQWLQYALLFLSLGAMLSAQKSHFWRWTALALAASILELSVTEYFAPVDLVRPLLLGLYFLPCIPRRKARIQRVLLVWLPYLAVLSAFVVWRLFFIRLPGADPYQAKTLYALLSHPLAALRDLSVVVITDVLRILVGSWADLLHFEVAGAAPFTLFTYAVGAAAAVLLVIYFLRLQQDDPPSESAHWSRQAFVLGLVALLLGPIPAWVSGRQVVFDFHSDRYAMPAMFGAALLFASGIFWLAQKRLQQAVLCALLIGLAVGLHLRVANDYRWIWTNQQRFFWQMTWRAPTLKAPTALFLENEPFPNQGLFSTSAALNLMYPQTGARAADGATLDYWVYSLLPRYANQLPDSFAIPLHSSFRTLTFVGQTPQSLLLYNDPSHANCVWVLSARDQENPYLSDLMRHFLPIANLDQILPAAPPPGYPPQDLLGAEPVHTSWCYYFEKADLARQFADWQTAARLGNEAVAAGYRPDRQGSNAPYEWLPFIEGLAHSGEWDEAARLTRRAFEQDPAYQTMFCSLWMANLASPDNQAGQILSQTRTFLGCPP